ncbi:MAG: helix-turn-helix transcriptional regulator [Clostridia bacterium]|nr:helix-turn-helix transcriptional regulator [Clostridia bacterium]
MENNDIKQNIAKNISELRKANKLTQLELAEKLNYSDKAISRWERGDTLPDIDILCEICKLFNVKFEYLIEDNSNKQPPTPSADTKWQTGNRLTISLLAVSVIWILATFLYVYSDIIFDNKLWKVFIWAVPVTFIVAIVCNHLWGKKLYTVILLSGFTWTALAAIFIQYLSYNLWPVFLLGIPIQITILLWSQLKPRNKN